MSTHNICFYDDLTKIIFQLSSNFIKQTSYLFIALDKAAYCEFTQFLGPENAIKFIAKRTKTQ